jgi:hypothetical protein
MIVLPLHSFAGMIAAPGIEDKRQALAKGQANMLGQRLRLSAHLVREKLQ